MASIADREYRGSVVIGRFLWRTRHVFCDFCRKHGLPGMFIAGRQGYVIRLPGGRESLIGGTCAATHCKLQYAGRALTVKPQRAIWVPLIDRRPRRLDEPRPPARG